MRTIIAASVKKELLSVSGNKCAYPNCDFELLTDDGSFLGNICFIESIANGAPRHNPQRPSQELVGLDNLILLCPNHHQLIDSQVHVHTAEWLKKTKIIHEKKMKERINNSSLIRTELSKISTVPFQEILDVWEKNQENGDEEFWQVFLKENPCIIAQATPRYILKLGQKCFLGGKNIENKGGNIIDFLYVTSSSNNVVLVEIKTPLTKLVGSLYRANAYALTEELSGTIVQVLNYRDELLKNYYTLTGNDPSLKFSAFNPKCFVIAGNLELENLNSIQRKSFELFRSASNVVEIMTFDELFGKMRDLVDLVSG